MKVADLGVIEQASNVAEHRIAEITVQERHRTGRNAAGEAIAHDEIAAVTQFGHKKLQAGKIVTVIGVAHDDETALGRRDAGPECRTIATFRNRDDMRAAILRQRDGTVGRAVVGDQNLPHDFRCGQEMTLLSRRRPQSSRPH